MVTQKLLRLSFVISSLNLFYSTITANNCYYPHGDIAPNDVVCFPFATDSFCCGLGYACLANKLCMRTPEATDSQPNGALDRGSCTDSTFTSDACPQFCTNAGTNQEGGSAVIQCNGGDQFCCGGDNCNCNTGQNLVSIAGPSYIETIIPNSAAVTTVSYSTPPPTVQAPAVPSNVVTTPVEAPPPATTMAAVSTTAPPVAVVPSSPTATAAATGITTTGSPATASVTTSTASASVKATKSNFSQSTSTGSSIASSALNSAQSQQALTAAVSSQPSSPSSQGDPTATPVANSSNALKIGLGVGIPVGIIAICGIAFLAWLYGRRQSRSRVAQHEREIDEAYNRRSGSKRWDGPPQELAPAHPPELSSMHPDQMANELPAY